MPMMASALRTAWLRQHTPAYGRGVSRLPFVTRDQLGADGRGVWDSIVASRGGQSVSAQGWMTGPFNAFVQAPDVGRHLDPLGSAMRFGTSVERRLAEVAILTVAARWRAEFEWQAHVRLARDLGLPEAAIDAIARGDDPPFTADDERAVHQVARQLTETGQLGQEAYDAAQRLLGDSGLVELVSMIGYYTLVSFILNAFAVPVAPGAEPQWPGRA
jgi:4-carboxymuconolactone decarboxylase